MRNSSKHPYIFCLVFFTLFSISSISFAVDPVKEGEVRNVPTKEIDPEKSKCNKTDSLAGPHKKAQIKIDSTANRGNNQSSMSSMSYNILFQVIYRYSFKEIFDSPAAPEIITN